MHADNEAEPFISKNYLHGKKTLIKIDFLILGVLGINDTNVWGN